MSVILINASPKMSFYHEHSHNVWEIILNQYGNGHMIIGGAEYPFTQGTITCLPPNVPHIKYGKGPFRDMYLWSSSFVLSGLVGSDDVIFFQDNSEKSFETLFLMANSVYHRKEKNYSNLLDSLYDTMEQLLVSWYQHTPENIVVERLKNKIVNSFVDPKFSLKNLLSEFSYNNDYLRRVFKQATGFTPLEYLTELRINNAKKLLRKNNILHYTITEISEMSGFDDADYFSRVFKKKTSQSPSDTIS